MHPVWVIIRCTFWLTSTVGEKGGGGGGHGKGDRRWQGGRGVILGQILADVICERSLTLTPFNHITTVWERKKFQSINQSVYL